MINIKLKSLSGLARELKLPIHWLKAETDAGRIPCLRAGRKRLFNIEAVLKVLAERAAQPQHISEILPDTLDSIKHRMDSNDGSVSNE